MNIYPLNSNQPKFEFDKNRKRVKFCPCGRDNKSLKFVPFVGHEKYGYCFKCDECYYPESSNENQTVNLINYQTKWSLDIIKNQVYIPFEIYYKILIDGKAGLTENNFIKWLINPERGKYKLPNYAIENIIGNYFLGNWNNYNYKGWILFPYIDINNRLTEVKAIDYNPKTGKRIKEPYPKCHFIGKKLLTNQDANTGRCFFGEHLLIGNNKNVMLFESEATAVYASVFYPEVVCLATGGKNGCKWTEANKCEILKGHKITLYPDIDSHNDWEEKAEILKEYGINVSVSNLIINSAEEYARAYNIDINLLIKGKFDLRDILKYKNLDEFLHAEALQAFEKWILNNPQGGLFKFGNNTLLIKKK